MKNNYSPTLHNSVVFPGQFEKSAFCFHEQVNFWNNKQFHHEILTFEYWVFRLNGWFLIWINANAIGSFLQPRQIQELLSMGYLNWLKLQTYKVLLCSLGGLHVLHPWGRWSLFCGCKDFVLCTFSRLLHVM